MTDSRNSGEASAPSADDLRTQYAAFIEKHGWDLIEALREAVHFLGVDEHSVDDNRVSEQQHPRHDPHCPTCSDMRQAEHLQHVEQALRTLLNDTDPRPSDHNAHRAAAARSPHTHLKEGPC